MTPRHPTTPAGTPTDSAETTGELAEVAERVAEAAAQVAAAGKAKPGALSNPLVLAGLLALLGGGGGGLLSGIIKGAPDPAIAPAAAATFATKDALAAQKAECDKRTQALSDGLIRVEESAKATKEKLGEVSAKVDRVLDRLPPRRGGNP